MRMIRSRAAALSAAVVASLALAGPAFAGGPGGDASPPTTQPVADPGGTGAGDSSSGGSYYGAAGGCHVVSTANSLGSFCPGSAQDTESIKARMKGEKFKECWDDPMTADDQAAYGYYPGANGEAQPYVHRCLRGIDPKTLAITGPIYVEENPVWIYPPYRVVTIGNNERTLVEIAGGAIPYPVAGVSPNTQPRVGQWISFFDAQPDQMVGDTGDHQVVVNTLGVRLVAQEDRIVVRPRGLNIDDSVTCPGGGHRAEVGEQGTAGGNCWYRYQRSSAGQTDEQYPVRITAYWTVYQEVGGVRTQINAFQKSVTTRLRVTEIQSINVS